jgi:hypothetical protein
MEITMSNRIERLKQYGNPRSRDNWHGASRDMANINRWSKRAEAESDGHRHRAKDDGIALPSTDNRQGSDEPKTHEKAKRNLNHEGSTKYMPKVRRNTE